jgi:hypothetical protein
VIAAIAGIARDRRNRKDRITADLLRMSAEKKVVFTMEIRKEAEIAGIGKAKSLKHGGKEEPEEELPKIPSCQNRRNLKTCITDEQR